MGDDVICPKYWFTVLLLIEIIDSGPLLLISKTRLPQYPVSPSHTSLLRSTANTQSDLSFPQIHSIHQRRKVVGRSKNFDQLVAELKTRVREKGSQALEGGSSTGQSLSPEAPREQAGTPHCRRPLVTLPAFRL